MVFTLDSIEAEAETNQALQDLSLGYTEGRRNSIAPWVVVADAASTLTLEMDGARPIPKRQSAM